MLIDVDVCRWKFNATRLLGCVADFIFQFRTRFVLIWVEKGLEIGMGRTTARNSFCQSQLLHEVEETSVYAVATLHRS